MLTLIINAVPLHTYLPHLLLLGSLEKVFKYPKEAFEEGWGDGWMEKIA
jgi:hypothetical protein